MSEEWVTPAAAAARSAVSESTILRRCRQGKIDAREVWIGDRKVWQVRVPSGGGGNVSDVTPPAAETAEDDGDAGSDGSLARWEAPEVWLARFEATARRLGQAEGERDAERARAERAEAEGRRLQQQLQQQSGLISEANQELARSEEQLIEARARLARRWWKFWEG